MTPPPFDGDWQLERSELPAGGPQRWWRSSHALAISGPPQKLEPELEGRARGAEHPALPRQLDGADGWLLLEPLGPPPLDPLSAVQGWPGVERLARGPLLSLLPPARVNLRRALRKLDCKRVDRTLDRPAEATVVEGPSLGGIDGGWLRETADGRVVCLRFSRFAAQGRPDLDRAVTAWKLGLPCSDIGLLPHLLEEAVLGRDDDAAAQAREVFQRLARPEPSQVEVRVEGAPEWLDPEPWTGARTAAEARRILHAVDGLRVAGSTLSVEVTPPIRKGRGPRVWEGRDRRRLFSRWYEGVQADDEGLFSITPEALATEMVEGVSGTVLDATCGVGSLAIAAARAGARVVASDTSQARLDMAGHNAGLYGVELELRRGPASRVVAEVEHDVLLLDPPWGGRDYDRDSVGLEELGFDLRPVLAASRAEVRVKLPRSFRVDELPGGPWSFRAAVDDRGVLKFLVATRC